MKTVRLVSFKGELLGNIEVPDDLPFIIRLAQSPPTVAVRDDGASGNQFGCQYRQHSIEYAATVLPLKPWEQSYDQRYRGESYEEAVSDLHARLSNIERQLNASKQQEDS